MTQHNAHPTQPESVSNSMDIYFAELASGPDHYLQLVQGTWDNMTPTDRLDLQKITREFAGDDVTLGQEFARSQLLFAYAMAYAQTAGRAALTDEIIA